MTFCLWLIDLSIFLMPRNSYRQNLIRVLIAYDQAIIEKIKQGNFT